MDFFLQSIYNVKKIFYEGLYFSLTQLRESKHVFIFTQKRKVHTVKWKTNMAKAMSFI